MLTVIVCAVEPVDHKYAEYPDPASNIVDVPEQMLLFPVMTGAIEFTVTVTGRETVQPLLLVAVIV